MIVLFVGELKTLQMLCELTHTEAGFSLYNGDCVVWLIIDLSVLSLLSVSLFWWQPCPVTCFCLLTFLKRLLAGGYKTQRRIIARLSDLYCNMANVAS